MSHRSPRPPAPILLVALLPVFFLPACRAGGRLPATSPPGPAQPATPSATPHRGEVVPEEGGFVTFALEDPFTGFAAPRLATVSDRSLRGLAFRGLARFAPSGAAEPELAARWETLREGREWVFHLRPDTRFSNGRPLEARHVVASWEKVIADRGSPHAWLLDAVAGSDEMRAGEEPHASGLVMEDGLTLRVILKRPVLNLPLRLAHPALGVSAYGEDEAGIGPYQVWGTSQPRKVVLRSNPEYFGGLPHLDEITFVRGEAARRENLSTGGLDGTAIGPGEEVPGGPGLRLLSHSVPRTYLLGLNRTAAPFSRPDTTRLFLASLDRTALLAALGDGGGRVPETIVPALAPGRRAEDLPAKPLTRSSSLGRLDVAVPDADPGAASLAAKMQADLARAGAHVLVHPVLPADLAGVLARREYHLFILPYLPSTPDHLINYEEVIRWNRSIPASYLAQIRGMEREADLAALLAALGPLDASLQTGGYLVPLVALERRYLSRRALCNLRPDPVGSLDWGALWVSRDPRGECGER